MLKKKKHVEEDGDDFRGRAAKGKRAKEEKGRFKFQQGENTFRILKTPADKDRNSPSVFIYWKIHRHVGPKDGWGRCGYDADGNGECWLEDTKIPELKKRGKTKTAAGLEADDVFSVQLAVYDDNTEEWRGPLRCDSGVGGPKSMNYRLESIITSTKRDAVDPKKGYNITIERTGAGKLDTTYGPTIYDDEPSAVPKGIMAKLKPFEDILPQYDEEQLKAAYFGRDAEETEEEEEKPRRKPKHEEEEEEEEEQPRPKKPSKKPRRDEEEEEEVEEEESGDEEEVEEESEEEEVEEEEEEQPRPKKKPGKPVKKPKRHQEEEDEEESDEEQEESEEDESSEPDEEEQEAEEYEEEEETPKKKSKKPVKKPKPEPEDEEEYEEEETESEEEEEEAEPEEEEEEEEEPAPKKKPLKKKKH